MIASPLFKLLGSRIYNFPFPCIPVLTRLNKTTMVYYDLCVSRYVHRMSYSPNQNITEKCIDVIVAGKREAVKIINSTKKKHRNSY